MADVSHPNVAEQIDSVEDTLAELDPARMPRILVLNKIDSVKKDPLALLPSGTTQEYNAIVPISARTGLGIDRLMVEIEQLLAKGMGQLHILVPFERGDIVSRIHEQGSVISERHTPEGVEVRCRVPQELAAQIGGIAAVIDLSRKKSKTECTQCTKSPIGSIAPGCWDGSLPLSRYAWHSIGGFTILLGIILVVLSWFSTLLRH